MSQTSQQTMAILVGGGPAPGINGVISAATLKAIDHDLRVLGLFDGYKWLVKGDASHHVALVRDDVSRIHFDGGSILRTSRTNPSKTPGMLANCVQTLRDLNVAYLVTIGGDDTGFGATSIAKASQGKIKVVHVPKTIDNDLPLKGGVPTFGFQTARHVGFELVRNIMRDSETTGRWYFVSAMGRKAGHLALGIGKAAGATLTLIGEEFGEGTTLQHIADVLEGSILKRRVHGKTHGVAVLAEGLVEHLAENELVAMDGVEIVRDAYGHIQLSEIDIAVIMKRMVKKRFADRGEEIGIVSTNIGYELRCAPPIPFDCEYVRDLGYGAVRYLLGANYFDNGAMITLQDGKLEAVPFEDLIDPATGKTRVRLVELNTESYEVAREYMIRIEPHDFDDPDMMERLAAQAQRTPDALKQQFAWMRG